MFARSGRRFKSEFEGASVRCAPQTRLDISRAIARISKAATERIEEAKSLQTAGRTPRVTGSGERPSCPPARRGPSDPVRRSRAWRFPGQEPYDEASPAPATIPRRAGGSASSRCLFKGRKERTEEEWQPEYESRSRSPAPSASGGTTRPTSRSGTRPTASSSGSIAAGAAGTRFTGRRARHGPVPSVPDPAQARGLPAAGRRRARAPAPPGGQARRSAEEPDGRQARTARGRPSVHGGVLGRAQEGRVAGPPAADLRDHRRHHSRRGRGRLPLRRRLRPPALRARRPPQSLI